MDREPNLNDNYGLQELGDSDFEIADNEPDIRGWTVKDNQGRKIGEVDELIFDPESRQVRYIVLDLEGNVLDLELRDVLVPIGLAELHESDDDVILPGVSAEQVRGLPIYEKGRITRDIETAVRSAFARVGAAAASAGAALERTADKATGNLTNGWKEFYEHEHFDEKKLYRNRPASLARESRITPRTTTTPPTVPSPSKPDSTTMTGTSAPPSSGTGSGTGLGTSGAGTMGTDTTNPSTTSGTTGTTSPGTSGAWGTGSTGTGSPGTTGTPPSGTGTSNPPTRSTEDNDAHPHIET